MKIYIAKEGGLMHQLMSFYFTVTACLGLCRSSHLLVSYETICFNVSYTCKGLETLLPTIPCDDLTFFEYNLN